MLTSVALTLLLAAPVAAQVDGEEALILVLDLEAEGVKPREARLLTGRVARALSELEGMRAVTSADLKDLVELEEEKQLVGDCDTDSCLSEIAAALGARYLVNGQVGRIGSLVVLQLGLFDAEGAGWLAREEVEAAEMGALATRAPDAARALFGVKPPPPQQPRIEEGSDGVLPVAVMAAGGGAAVVGAGLAVGMGLWAVALDQQLRAPGTEVSPTEKAAIQGYALVPIIGLGVGAVLGVGGLVVAGLGWGLQ